MSKRQEIRERRQRQQRRNRILMIALVAGGVLLIAFAFVLPGIRQTGVLGTPTEVPIVAITPRALTAPMSGVTMGDPNAPVKMDVWEDFQCSGCMYYTDNIEPQIVQSYIETGKVYYTFHFFPFIDGGAGESHQAANAALCANEQGHFWDYHDILFANWTGENVGAYKDTRLVAFAQQLGLDMTAFNKCFQANTYADQINQDYQAGSAKGVPPTPAIFVNGNVVVSSQGQNYIASVADLSAVIDAALAGK